MGLNVITEFVIGFLYPGRPLANVTFKTYGYISMTQALYFLRDFKLGHYMKIPPKSMFFAQVKKILLSAPLQNLNVVLLCSTLLLSVKRLNSFVLLCSVGWNCGLMFSPICCNLVAS